MTWEIDALEKTRWPRQEISQAWFALKGYLSEVGFEPTPTDVDQNTLVRLLLSLAP